MDEVARMVLELDAALEKYGRHLTSTRVRLRRQMAAAGLWRARSLLMGMLRLREAGQADILGLLGRAIFETYALSLYVLLKGADREDDSALLDLTADNVFWLQKVAKVEGLSKEERFSDVVGNSVREQLEILKVRGVTPHSLNFAAISDQLGPLLTAAEGEACDVRQLYDTLYRAESMFSAHASQGSLIRYLKWDPAEQNDSLMSPRQAFSGQTRVAALLVTHLAIRVLKEFAVVVEPPLSELFGRLASDPAPDEP